MKGDWILISNLGDSATGVQIYLGASATPVAEMTVAAAGSEGDHVEWQSSGVVTDGPVRVVSTTGQPLGVSQRVIYKDTFNEIRGIDEFELESDYVFTWYDNNRASGMNGNWVLVANHDDNNFDSAGVQISIGGIAMSDPENPSHNYFIVASGGHITPRFAGITGGPVSVSCQNCNSGQKLIVSQRVLFKDSFEEVQGASPTAFAPPAAPWEDDSWTFPIPVPPESGETVTVPPPNDMGVSSNFNWYDAKMANGMMGDWILVANGSSAAEVVGRPLS